MSSPKDEPMAGIEPHAHEKAAVLANIFDELAPPGLDLMLMRKLSLANRRALACVSQQLNRRVAPLLRKSELHADHGTRAVS